MIEHPDFNRQRDSYIEFEKERQKNTQIGEKLKVANKRIDRTEQRILELEAKIEEYRRNQDQQDRNEEASPQHSPSSGPRFF